MVKEHLKSLDYKKLQECVATNPLSRSQLVKAVGLSTGYFSRLINGRVPMPVETGRKLYAALGLELPNGSSMEDGFDQHWNVLFEGYVDTLRSYYRDLPREEKLEFLNGLEALVQDKPR